jgi:hypothetical protein
MQPIPRNPRRRTAQQHLVAADLRANSRHAVLDDVAGPQFAAQPADLAHEAPQDLAALQAVRHLGMKLHAVEAPRLIGHGRERRVVAGADDLESRRHRDDAVAVAHPHIEHAPALGVAIVFESVEQPRVGGRPDLRAPNSR